MKKTLLAVAGIIVFLGILLSLTMGENRKRVEVCITFGGRTECRTASGATLEEAERTAVQNACALLASGMTASMACERTAPTSVRVLSGGR
ncbi:MAG: hypothetical protein IT160_17195 [Bryobacterales bacterium]|nr:hypothetical protein [Bryobacterales bacterium]